MPSPKRERQRESRQVKQVETARTTKRRQRGKQIRTLLLLVGGVVLIGALVALLSGDDDDGEAAGTEDPELVEEVLARTPPTPEGAPADLAPDAVEVTTLIEGEGEALVAGDTIVAHYVGVLPSGEEFDQSWERGEPLEVTIPGGVIDGWNEGLVGVKAGERRRLEIGAEKAYGSAGRPNIPPDTPLAFEIDVVDIRKA
ncbi:MAG: FKBP-type peptidyl-prolyl cis-trans isomerase [Acidimicrobiia bacterium]